MRRPLPELLAEAAGTFVLVFAGCGAIMIDTLSGGRITHVGIALTFGLAIAVMIASLGRVSGAHFNPAVTVALAWQRYFPAGRVAPYIAAQLAGALLAALLLLGLFGPAANIGATRPDGAAWQAFVLEVFLTAVLVFVIACVALETPAAPWQAPIAIGGTVAMAALFAGPVTGASMNPARSLAPALVSGQLGSIWIYVIAPLIGGMLGILLFRALQRPTPEARP